MTPYNQYPPYGMDEDNSMANDNFAMPRHGTGGAAPAELVCRCPSCASTLGVSAENAEHVKVQCMVCGTIFSPLGTTVRSGAPNPPVSAHAGQSQFAPSYPEPPAYGGIHGSAYPEPSYAPSAQNSNMNRRGGYPNDGYSDPYFSPEPSPYPAQPGSGYADNNPYYRDPSAGYAGANPGGYSAPYPAQGTGAYPPIPPVPTRSMPPSQNPYPSPLPPAGVNPTPSTPAAAYAPPGIQQLPVRKPVETTASAKPEKIEKPSAKATEETVEQAKKEALTGTEMPLGQDLESIGTSQPFKLIKSEYDYYMKDEEAPPKKKGSFLKILFFLFLPLVGIGWSLWQLILEKSADFIQYGGICVLCFVIFLLALSAYNRNCPTCGRWSALIKERKEDQYGRYVLRHCKHCDFSLESEK